MIEIDTMGLIYYSYLDEANFFGWAQSLDCISSVDGGVLHIDTSKIDEPNLRDLLALLTRYDLPATKLAALLSNDNRSWYGSKNAYWHRRVFESA